MLRVLDGKLIVEGVNVVKKHQKPNPVKGVQGGVVEKPCRLMFPTWLCSTRQTQKADRVGFKLLEDGRKVRVFKSNGEVVGA